MKREAIGEGPTVEEALDAALEELGVQQDAINYEVVEEGGKRLFGLGSERQAQVRAWLKDDFVGELEDAKRVAREILDVPEDPKDDIVEVPPVREMVDSEDDVVLQDEDLDRVADEASGAIKEILSGFGIEAEIEEYEGDEGEIILDIVGSDLGVLIGRHGRTLDGIQTLVGAATSRKLGFRHPVVVDVEGYRHRRRQKVEQISKRSADRADRQSSPVKLRPMTSYERRIVHVCLRDDARVKTSSDGNDPFRHVVISPK